MAQRTTTCLYFEAIFASVGFFLLFVVSEAQDLNEKCVTPNNLMGECTAIRSCPYVLSMLQTRLSSGHIDTLRRFQCGFQGSQPYVCCPDEVQSKAEMTEVRDHPNIQLLPRANRCGMSYRNALIKDPQANLYQYPWLALIGYSDENGLRYRCGGSIISERYILTAAHCISQLPNGLQLSTVRIGEHNLNTDMDCEDEEDIHECAPPALDYGIEETIPHPKFQKLDTQNDIGLIRLDSPINFSLENTRPICLPLDEKPLNFTRRLMAIGGWGVTMEGKSSSKLLTAEIRVVNTEVCADQYKKITDIYNSTQICLQPEYTGRKICVSDSGGPLMNMRTGDGNAVQYGVMSFAVGACKSYQYPRVYTLVPPYMEWILDSIKS